MVIFSLRTINKSCIWLVMLSYLLMVTFSTVFHLVIVQHDYELQAPVWMQSQVCPNHHPHYKTDIPFAPPNKITMIWLILIEPGMSNGDVLSVYFHQMDFLPFDYRICSYRTSNILLHGLLVFIKDHFHRPID